MAIRSEPPHALARLRLSWHHAWDRHLNSWLDFRARIVRRHQSTIDGVKTISARAAVYLNPRLRAEEKQRVLYNDFVRQYEELVDVLCWAAKDGIHTDRDLRYARLRDWMQRHYHRVRPSLRPHLGSWEGPLDPFEELFAPDEVDAVINSGDCIPCVIQTRSALAAYDNASRCRSVRH